jgi:DNA-binding MarR family transcriptional regulator
MAQVLVLLTEKDRNLLRCILKLHTETTEECFKCLCEPDCGEDGFEILKDDLYKKLGL